MKYFLIQIAFTSLLFSQNLTFPKEDITFYLGSKHFVVEGNYLFRNNTDQQITRNILYPFPDKKSFGRVDSVYIKDLTTQKELSFERNRNHITFNLIIPSLDSSLIHIYYRQEIQGNSVKYILTTTSLWNNPFETAEYKLIVDPRLEITFFSYKPDKEYLIGINNIFYWEKRDFMPDKDMVFRFTQKQ